MWAAVVQLSDLLGCRGKLQSALSTYASERTRTHIDRCTRLGVDPDLPSTVSPALSSSTLPAPTLRNSSIPTGGTAPQPPRAPLAFSGNSSAAPALPCFCLFCPACGCRGGACRCSCPPSCAICHSSAYTPFGHPPPLARSPAAPGGLSPFSPSSCHGRAWQDQCSCLRLCRTAFL